MARFTRTTAKAAAVAATMTLSLISGCQSTVDGSRTAENPESRVGDSKEILEQAFSGTTFQAPESGPPAQSGANVWLLTCISLPSCQTIGDSFKQAAQSLGWDITELDNKLDPTTTITQIRQAVSARVDAVVVVGMDCPAIKAGLDSAKSARIPVVSAAGADCDDPAVGGTEQGFAATTNYLGANNATELYQLYGERNADVTVAAARESGIEAPKILDLRRPDFLSHKVQAEAFDRRVEEICPECELIKVDYTRAQLNVPGSQLVRNTLQRHPDANVVFFPFDKMLDYGLQTALETTNNIKLVCCGDGGGGGVEYAKKSRPQLIINAYAWGFAGYAAADTLNRLLAGDSREQIPNMGGYILYVEKNRNLPTVPGEQPAPPLDALKGFSDIWFPQGSGK
ncbi:MAG: sugar ABC transporter substrate-binding protein [Alcaligenaceae bacterium]|nr:MAG: sugar ABC transporter substrate-binding protein [Alcaligenaceae bacterium]